MASSDQQTSINPNTGYCSATKTFHSIRPTISLPSPTLPLTSASYALSLYLSSSSSSNSTVPALIDSTTSLCISYSQFLHRIQILSSFLQTHFPFLINGQIAFVLSPSTVHVPVLYFSLLSLGIVVSPSNPANTASEISRQIQLSNPVFAFATSSTSHKLPSSLPTLLLDSPIFLSLFSTSSSSDVPRHHHHHLLGPTSVRQSDPAAILYSSGTTGNFKGVVLTHRNLMAMVAGAYALRARGEPPAVVLLTVPMFHVYGLMYSLRWVAMGEKMVVMEGRFEIGRLLRTVEEFRVTHVMVAPPVVVAMGKGDVAERYDLRSLQVVGCGGAQLTKDAIEWFNSRFPNVQLAQVPPAELEQLLFSHPDIIDAAVIPYPDEESGQVPMAFVVRQPQSTLCEAQVIDFVAKQVAPYKKIRKVSFINSIPKNPSGKLLRKDLIKLATSTSSSSRL